jgi:hypothetical protein
MQDTKGGLVYVELGFQKLGLNVAPTDYKID